MSLTREIVCSNCGKEYPEGKVVYCCPKCGGVFDFRKPFPLDLNKVEAAERSLWRYRHSFGLPESAEPVSLGEGGTPLVWVEVRGRRVACKCEYLNPTGSFKDRGSSLIATWLRSQGVKEAVEDSSGNAGASFAAYAARGGMRARIFIPEAASGPKRAQIEAYGAELAPVNGSRQDVTEAALQAVKKGAAYGSHAYLPFNLPGYATAAYEMYEQMGGMPGAVIVPAGQGGFLLGLARGFDALRIAIGGSASARIIGVQARACAPLWAAFTNGRQGMALASDHATVAEGVRVRYPLRGDAVLNAVRQSKGTILAVDEPAILPARDALARQGLYVEPTSALAWAVLEEVMDDLPDPIGVVLTGFGLKYGVK